MILRLTLALVVLVVTACSETGAPADTTLPPALSTFPAPSQGSQAPSSTAPSSSLAGVQNVTRIRNGLSDLAHDWGLIDPEGSYIGPVDESGGILLVEPVEGYGDFSGLTIQQRFDLDATTVQELTYECVSDIDSRFAQVITDTGDFNWYQLPGQLAQVGMAVYIACQQGLQLPPLAVADYTPQMWAELYAHRMAWVDCIEREAHIDWGPRVTLDQLISQGGAVEFSPGHPYTTLDNAMLHRLDVACPSRPPGGFGAWDPGDPIAPVSER